MPKSDFFIKKRTKGEDVVLVCNEMIKEGANMDRTVYGFFDVGSLKDPITEILSDNKKSGENIGNVKCKWIVPEKYFFTDKAVLRGANTNTYCYDEKFSDYLPPLREEILDYLTPKELEKCFKWEDTGEENRKKAVLNIPISGTRESVHCEKIYDDNNTVRDLPASPLAIWPNFRSNDGGWSLYYLICENRGDGNIGVDVDIKSDINKEQLTAQPLILKMDSFPEGVVFKHNQEPCGLIMPKTKQLLPGGGTILDSVAIDFGTSNSCWMAKGTGDPDKYSFSSVPIRPLVEDIAKADGFLITYFSNIGRVNHIFPSVYRKKSDQITHDPQKNGIIIFTNLTDWKGFFINTAALQPNEKAERSRILNSLEENLKWSRGVFRQHINMFLRHKLLLIAVELRKQGFKGTNQTLFSYPLSMQRSDRFALKNSFENAVEWVNKQNIGFQFGKVEFHSESIAVAEYAKRKMILAPGAPSPQLIIDIGGGTSDIAAWANNNLILQTSAFIGGNIIPNYIKSIVSAGDMNLINEIKELMPDLDVVDIREQFLTKKFISFNVLMSGKGEDLCERIKAMGGGSMVELRQLIFFMFSALFYYAGILIRYCYKKDGYDKEPQVAITGNGGKLINIVGNPQALAQSFSRILNKGIDIPDVTFKADDLNLRSSGKEAVASGLLYGRGQQGQFDMQDTEECRRFPVGESGYTIQGNNLDTLDDFEEPAEEDRETWKTSKLFVKSPGKFDELEKFLEITKSEWKNIEGTGKDLTLSPHLTSVRTFMAADLRNMLMGRTPWESLFIKEVKIIIARIWGGATMDV